MYTGLLPLLSEFQKNEIMAEFMKLYVYLLSIIITANQDPANLGINGQTYSQTYPTGELIGYQIKILIK